MTELREKTNSLKCCDIDPDPVRSEEAAVEKDDAQKANKGTGEDSPENEMKYFNPPFTKVQKILTTIFLVTFIFLSIVPLIILIAKEKKEAQIEKIIRSSRTAYSYELINGYKVKWTNYFEWTLFDARGNKCFSANAFFKKEHLGENDTLSVYADKGYRGFVSLTTGKEVIPASSERFTKAWFFDQSSGLAAVQDAETQKIGFISPQGNYVVEPQYDYVKGYDYKIIDEQYIVAGKDANYTIVSIAGDTIVAQCSRVSERVTSPNGEVKYRIIERDGKQGIWCEGALVLPIEYDRIQLNEQSIELEKDLRIWEVAYDLQTILIPNKFEQVSAMTYYDENDALCVYVDDPLFKDLLFCESEETIGVYNRRTQQIVVPMVWERMKVVRAGERTAQLFGYNGNYWIPIAIK